MARILAMPSLSPSMEEGVVESWTKKVGDFVESGEVLANIETDKAVVEYEVLDDGYLRHIFIADGDSAQVGEPFAIFSETPDENIHELIESAKNTNVPAPQAIVEPSHDAQAMATTKATVNEIAPPPPKIETSTETQNDGRLKISPVASRMALEHNVDLSQVQGSGPKGRIVKADIEKAIQHLATASQTNEAPASKTATTKAKPTPVIASDLDGEYEEIPLTSMRKTIATRLVESTQNIPHFFLTTVIQMDEFLQLRKHLNESMNVKISVNDMIIKACGNALMDHPQVNTHFTSSGLRQYKNASVGFAVATPDGLITPIIRNVNQKGLGQIAKETKDMAERAKIKKLAIEEFTGGTFGTSNLGMFGIDQFTAIINPPQSCNLAIGRTSKELVLNEQGEVTTIQQMKLTISCDHRVVDGALGALFLQTLKKLMENPLAFML